MRARAAVDEYRLVLDRRQLYALVIGANHVKGNLLPHLSDLLVSRLDQTQRAPCSKGRFWQSLPMMEMRKTGRCADDRHRAELEAARQAHLSKPTANRRVRGVASCCVERWCRASRLRLSQAATLANGAGASNDAAASSATHSMGKLTSRERNRDGRG